MHGGDGDREGFGRALRLGALAVSLLALVAVVGPRLASSGGGGAPAAASLPAGAAAGVTHDATAAASGPANSAGGTEAAGTAALTSPATTTTAATAASAVSTTTMVMAVAAAAAPTTTTAPSEVDGGAVDLAVAGLHAGRNGPPRQGFFAGDLIGWHFRVTNIGDEYLWGVFVYLEGYGPVTCAARRLEAGSGTDCWAETTAAPGEEAGEAWVTAWTSLRMVSDRLSQRILIPAA